MLLDKIESQEFDARPSAVANRRRQLQRKFYQPRNRPLAPEPAPVGVKPKPIDYSVGWSQLKRELPAALYLSIEMQDEIPAKTVVTRSEILKEVSQKYGFTEHDLTSDRRHKLLAQARFEYYWRCKNETTASYPAIARFINKDHTTAMHGRKVYLKLQNEKANGVEGGRYNLALVIERPE